MTLLECIAIFILKSSGHIITMLSLFTFTTHYELLDIFSWPERPAIVNAFYHSGLNAIGKSLHYTTASNPD